MCYGKTDRYDRKTVWKRWKTIGQMLAENLGVNCYNREILRMASDDSGIKEELFNQADEKLRNNPLFGNSTRIYKGGLIQPDMADLSPQTISLIIRQK